MLAAWLTTYGSRVGKSQLFLVLQPRRCAVAERDPRQECGCPPWVECVHFGGEVLVIVAPLGSNPKELCPGCEFDIFRSPLWSVHGPSADRPCFDGGEPEARAELARRAELLRLGEPARA